MEIPNTKYISSISVTSEVASATHYSQSYKKFSMIGTGHRYVVQMEWGLQPRENIQPVSAFIDGLDSSFEDTILVMPLKNINPMTANVDSIQLTGEKSVSLITSDGAPFAGDYFNFSNNNKLHRIISVVKNDTKYDITFYPPLVSNIDKSMIVEMNNVTMKCHVINTPAFNVSTSDMSSYSLTVIESV